MNAPIAYFDCSAGVSGDMCLGALLDAGAGRAGLDAAIAALGLGSEVMVTVRHEERGHTGGTRVVVDPGPGPGRTVPQLRETVARAALPAPVRERSLAAIDRLGRAESDVHGRPEAALHLHELGGADTLVDLVGSFALLHSLGAGSVWASALPAPEGPHTAPGTLRVLAGTGAVLRPDPRAAELVTPTGAAILATIARFERPSMTVDAVGFGLGARDEPGNAVGLWLGRPVAEAAEVAVVETNLDDLAPNLVAALVEDLLAAGALDVTVTPLIMKKGRPGHRLSVMADRERATEFARMVLAGSPSFGVRIQRAERMVAGRRLLEVATSAGPVRVKIKELEGRIVAAKPEYEDCRRAGVDAPGTARVMAEAERLAWAAIEAEDRAG